MIERDDPAKPYSAVAKFFHWLTVMLVILQFGIAWSMPDVGRGTLPVGLIGWHLSIGVSILAITAARLAWRKMNPPPAAPSDLSPLLAVLSRATHWNLYALLLVLPILGWLNANARGWAVKLFGIVQMPKLVPDGTHWAMLMGNLHGNLAILFIFVIGLHVVGALYHALVMRDRTLARML